MLVFQENERNVSLYKKVQKGLVYKVTSIQSYKRTSELVENILQSVISKMQTKLIYN